MIKELQAEPFYKPNVIAMLNTLFPPVVKELPSMRVSKKALHQHRNSFYRYIVSIEKSGKSVLNGFVETLMRPGTGHTWSDTRQNLKDYVALADSMIKQARAVHGISYFKSIPEGHESVRDKRGSGMTSDLSDPTSLSTSGTKSSQSDLNRFSTKSEECQETTADYASSIGSSIMGQDSPNRKVIPVPRSRFSGKAAFQKISIQEDIDALFRGLTPSPWYSSPHRQSTGSGKASFENTVGSARLHSSSFSRPTTPSLEQQKIHRRSTSVPKRISYDFRSTLPGTPELPSPQANGKGYALETSGIDGATLSEHNVAFVEEPHEPEAPVRKKKKSTFSLFRRKKKPDSTSSSKQCVPVVQKESPSADVSSHAQKCKEHSSCHQTMEPVVPEQPTLKFPERPTLKMKSSFGFLKVRKTRDDARSVSGSNSERTITEATTQPKAKLTPRRSLNNLFMNRSTSVLPVDENEDSSKIANSTSTLLGRGQTLRKARSYSSVKSASSTYSNEGGRNGLYSDTSSVLKEDRVITSADIAEPFPFGSFVPPQTPAIVIEDAEEAKFIEDVRQQLLEKAREERLAKFEQSEVSKRRLEAARERRRALREEMDMNVQAPKVKKQKQKEEAGKKKVKQKATKSEPTTPIPGTDSSDKGPKTPLKARIIQEFASAYGRSPGSG